jgi:hypothetical protein
MCFQFRDLSNPTPSSHVTTCHMHTMGLAPFTKYTPFFYLIWLTPNRRNCPTAHVLMQCNNKSNLTWRNLNLSHYIEQALQQHDNIGGMIFYLLKTLSKQEQYSFVVNLWSLWRSRNIFIWDHINENTAEIIDKGSCLLMEWRIECASDRGTNIFDSPNWPR